MKGETDQERHQRLVAQARLRGFVHAYDRTDWLLALLLALTTWALLELFSSPVLHPEFWSGVAVASGARPPDTAASGLGLSLARWVIAKFGVDGGISTLMRLGHAAGALVVGLSFLLMRGTFSSRLSVKPQELLSLSPALRSMAVAGTFVLACSEALWHRMQFLSDELICLLLGVAAIVAFDRFRRHRRLGWHCLCSFATGLLAAETPVGFALAAGFHLWNRREKKRYWARRGALKVLVRDPNDPDSVTAKGRADAVVSFDEGRADDPAAFFDEELEDEIKLMASRQEAWLSRLVFLTGFVTALVIGARIFSGLGGLAVEDRTLWGFPVELVASWYRQARLLADPAHLLFTAVFSLVPFFIAFLLAPIATDAKDKFRTVSSLLVLLTGVVAWLQLSPFADCWYWTWDLGGTERAPTSLRAFMAFFGAAALMAALQTACCACRRQVRGASKIMVEEGVALARIRRLCRGLLAAVAVLVVALSANGVRRVDVCRKLEFVDAYVKAFAEQVKGLGWVFTDGAFDDGLAIRIRAQGEGGPQPLSMMSGRSAYAVYLRTRTAEDDEDRRVLKVGTLETLRFWAAERRDRLDRVGLQLGFEVLVKCRVTGARSAGLVLRTGTEADTADFDRKDAAVRELCEKALADTSSTAFGGLDRDVSDKFDFILWRLARMASLRASQYLQAEDGPAAARERELAKRLDAANAPYLKLKTKLERMGSDESLVLSPQEGLAVALKRGDFNLARPYANRMLRLDPEDLNANFAVGMWAVENRLYGVAVKYLETAREKRPDEPSILNNLAMVRFKLGDLEKAQEAIEHAAKANPESPEIRQNLKRIRDAVAKGAETNGVSKAGGPPAEKARQDAPRAEERPRPRAERPAPSVRTLPRLSRALVARAAVGVLGVILLGAGWMFVKPILAKAVSAVKRAYCEWAVRGMLKDRAAKDEKDDGKKDGPPAARPPTEDAKASEPPPTGNDVERSGQKSGRIAVSRPPEGPVAAPAAPAVPVGAETCDSGGTDAERLWNEAREMPHNFIPDFIEDREYLALLCRAAELGHVMSLVKLGDYAYRRGMIVEAYYWTLMANLHGETEVEMALQEMRKRWVQEGCPPEYENEWAGFAEQQGVFARAVLQLRCGFDAALARKCLQELKMDKCPEAELYLEKMGL